VKHIVLILCLGFLALERVSKQQLCTVVDIDECAPGGVASSCNETTGGTCVGRLPDEKYRCECQVGYVLVADARCESQYNNTPLLDQQTFGFLFWRHAHLTTLMSVIFCGPMSRRGNFNRDSACSLSR